MDRPARLFLCARCRVQVVLCSRCDRGNRYCSRQCRHQAREQARRETAQRYQRSWHGRIAHAQRSRRWRQRRAARDAAVGAGVDAQNVTHQGSRPGAGSAPLAAWTHDSTAVEVAGKASDVTALSAPQELAIATLTMGATCWACRRCGARQPAALRLGFVRHGLPARRRHDPSP
jgi:predicted ATP-dependent serine protease